MTADYRRGAVLAVMALTAGMWCLRTAGWRLRTASGLPWICITSQHM